jgi:hypothetical protein
MPAHAVARLLLHSLQHGHKSGTCPLYNALLSKGSASCMVIVPNAQDAVREAVFKVLGDLYLVFGGPSLSGGPLAPLHAPPAEAPLRRLWGVCEDILDQQVQVSPGVALGDVAAAPLNSVLHRSCCAPQSPAMRGFRSDGTLVLVAGATVPEPRSGSGGSSRGRCHLPLLHSALQRYCARFVI